MTSSPLTKVQSLIAVANFGAIKDKDQWRKDLSQTPFINHPVGVAKIFCPEVGYTNTDNLIGTLLHDTMKDTDTTFDEIERHFGTKIRQIVDDDSWIRCSRRGESSNSNNIAMVSELVLSGGCFVGRELSTRKK